MAKIIDKNLPIEFISELSRREANSRKPIYQIHKWFARKTDAIFRSLLIAMELEDFELDAFKDRYYSDNSQILKNKIILDPFAGGGTTLVNGLRLGAKVIGTDINPMAWFIIKNELQVPEADDVNNDYNHVKAMLIKEFNNLENIIGQEIKAAYTTRIYDKASKKYIQADIMYIFWIKKIVCPYCGEEIKAFPKYRITKSNKRMKNINICSKCWGIIESNDDTIECDACKNSFNVDNGTYSGRNITCRKCNSEINILKDVMKKSDSLLKMEMYAIEYYNPVSGETGFKTPDEADFKKFEDIKNNVENDGEIKNFIYEECNIDIPFGHNTKQLTNHNYKYWFQMFNERQIYFLYKLLKQIKQIKNSTVRELFLCTFSNMINANNMFCIYNAQCEKIEPLFGDHHMAPVINPIENNIWGTKLGRGSFIKYFNILLEAKAYNYLPYERYHQDNGNVNVYMENECVVGRFAKDFEGLLKSNENVLLKCRSSEKLDFIPDKTIDAIITDPPYYAAINYGEVSEFFYIWNRYALKDKYNCFNNKHIVRDTEVTVNDDLGICKDEFIKRLASCFLECKRVLKKDSPLVLTYNNSNSEGWSALYYALINSGFSVQKTYPVHTELRAGLIDSKRSKMNFDLILVCRETGTDKSSTAYITWKDFKNDINSKYKQICRSLNGIDINKPDSQLIRIGIVFELLGNSAQIFIENKYAKIEEIIDKIYLESNN